MKIHGWRLPPLGANVPASHTFLMSSGGTGSGRRRRSARVVRMPSSSGTSSPMVRKSILGVTAGTLASMPPLPQDPLGGDRDSPGSPSQSALSHAPDEEVDAILAAERLRLEHH